MFRDRDYFPAGINNYCKKMQMAAEFGAGMSATFSLGSPAANDTDILWNNVDSNDTAGTETSPESGANAALEASYYGRTIQCVHSGDPGATGGTFDVYGWDYLGQPMTERFSGANGSTAILYGKKAFKRLWKVKIVTASTNDTDIDIGTAWRLGLPYKGDLMNAKENTAWVNLYKRDFTMWQYNAAAGVAGGPSGFHFYSPCPGFVKTLLGNPGLPVGSTTDPVITVELATVAITGLTVTVDTSDTTGVTVTDTPTTAGYSANNRLRPATLIEVAIADADSGGPTQVGIEITPTQFTPAILTDPQTTTTGDPRGTYEPLMTPDGSEIIVTLQGDPSYNASGNGGLHGIQHV